MRKNRRLFGNNLKVLLVEKGITTEEFAQMIGCTEYNICQIIDARLFLDIDEEERIAKALETSIEDLYLERDFSEYEAAGCIECRGRFSNPENKKLVLDLLDIYCDIQEVVADEIM